MPSKDKETLSYRIMRDIMNRQGEWFTTEDIVRRFGRENTTSVLLSRYRRFFENEGLLVRRTKGRKPRYKFKAFVENVDGEAEIWYRKFRDWARQQKSQTPLHKSG